MSKARLSRKDNSKLGATFDRELDQSGYQLLEYDERSFDAILREWSVTLACDINNPAGFFKRTGLNDTLTTEEWQGLVKGTRAPDKKLAGILYVLMNESVKNPGGAQSDFRVPSFEVFMLRARHAREHEAIQQREDNIISITDETHRALRKPILQKLHDAIFPRIAAEWAEKTKRGKDEEIEHTFPFPREMLHNPILITLSERVNQTPELVLMGLANCYEKSPDEAFDIVRSNCGDIADVELRDWCRATLAPITKNPPHIGQMIRVLRQSQGDFVDAYDDGVLFPTSNHGSANSRWERGEATPEAHFLPVFKKCFQMDATEYQLLAESRLPQFNDIWLDSQPPETQGNHYLRRIMADNGAMRGRERGFFNTLAALNFSDREVALLAHYDSAPDRSTQHAAQNIARSFFRDPEGYFTQHNIPPNKQAGAMLTLCIDAGPFQQKQIAKKHLKCSESTVSLLRSGKIPFSPLYANPLATLFSDVPGNNKWFDKDKFLAIANHTCNIQRPVRHEPVEKQDDAKTAVLNAKKFFEDPKKYFRGKRVTLANQPGTMLLLCMNAATLDEDVIAQKLGCGTARVNSILNGTEHLLSKQVLPLANFIARQDEDNQWFDQKKFMDICDKSIKRAPVIKPKYGYKAITDQRNAPVFLSALFREPEAYFKAHRFMKPEERISNLLSLCMKAARTTPVEIATALKCSEAMVDTWLEGKELTPQLSDSLANFFARQDVGDQWFNRNRFLTICAEMFRAETPEPEPRPGQLAVKVGAMLTPEMQREAGIDLTAPKKQHR